MNCPCGWGRAYAECCGALHDGAAASSPEALMRSRYSAFALGRADYLARTTTAATTPAQQTELQQWSRAVTWLGLTVEEASGDQVQFVARYLEGEKVVSLGERSTFVQRDGRWLYAHGESNVSAVKVARNEPCPCGSGKKFKACHSS